MVEKLQHFVNIRRPMVFCCRLISLISPIYLGFVESKYSSRFGDTLRTNLYWRQSVFESFLIGLTVTTREVNKVRILGIAVKMLMEGYLRSPLLRGNAAT